VTGTNEVALWVHHPYIAPFSQLPHSITGSQSLCFPIHSQPRDPDPAIYTFTFPGLSSALVLRVSFLSRYVQVRMLTFCFNQIVFIYSLSSDIVHVGYLSFCVQVLVQQDLQPLKVYVRQWHVIILSVTQLHIPVTPSDILL
jgi:hypothetical protein